jgi:transposase
MRGTDEKQASMFSVVSPERRIPADHPLRRIKAMADEVLRGLSKTFDAMYSSVGRPSIPPERLLKSQILMALYTVRSDRQFCEQLDYNLLFRWFLDMNADEPTFDASSFSRNRDRLLDHDVAGTLIEAMASLKSFRRKDEKPEDREPPDDPGNPTVNFHGEKRSNETHQSTTDPEARLARKGGKESKMSYSAHALMENRNGLIVDFRVEEANGYAERRTAIAMLDDNAVRTAGLPSVVMRATRLPRDQRHATYRADTRYPTTICRGRPHHPARRISRESTQTEARRGDLRLDEDLRWIPEVTLQGQASHASRGHDRRGGLQPAPNLPADAGHDIEPTNETALGARTRWLASSGEGSNSPSN